MDIKIGETGTFGYFVNEYGMANLTNNFGVSCLNFYSEYRDGINKSYTLIDKDGKWLSVDYDTRITYLGNAKWMVRGELNLEDNTKESSNNMKTRRAYIDTFIENMKEKGYEVRVTYENKDFSRIEVSQKDLSQVEIDLQGEETHVDFDTLTSSFDADRFNEIEKFVDQVNLLLKQLKEAI